MTEIPKTESPAPATSPAATKPESTTAEAENPFEDSHNDSQSSPTKETAANKHDNDGDEINLWAAATEPAPVPTNPPSSTAPSSAPEREQPQSTPLTRERDGPIDPRVSALKAMFPDFDESLLFSVLESVGFEQDRAIDTLLGMSDPDYKSEQAHQPNQPMTQTELDEELARRLHLEDQEAHARAWEAEHRQHPQRQQQAPQTHQQQQQQGDGPDTMAEIQQQLNKGLEVGKKTLGTLFSKVKQKMSEFDQPSGAPGGPSHQPSWGQEQQHSQHSQHPPQQRQSTNAGAQPAYYDPNPSNQPSSPHQISLQGYDTATPTNPAAATPPPPSTNSGAPIDGGKVGVLPKRPVSLLRDEPVSSPSGGETPRADEHVKPQPQRHETDDSELEYAENPFEDEAAGRK